MGFIKNLIAGIIGFITGLFGGKKNGGYYLQLEETGTGSAPVVTPKPTDEASNGKQIKAVEAPKPEAATPVKADTKGASKNGKTATPEPVPAPAPAPVASSKPATTTETTFAPKYLIPSASGSNGRRRPGANMNSYLDMARQVKTPG